MNDKEIVREALSIRGITQAQLSQRAGYKGQTNITAILNNRAQGMRSDTFWRLLTALDYQIIIRDTQNEGADMVLSFRDGPEEKVCPEPSKSDKEETVTPTGDLERIISDLVNKKIDEMKEELLSTIGTSSPARSQAPTKQVPVKPAPAKKEEPKVIEKWVTRKPGQIPLEPIREVQEPEDPDVQYYRGRPYIPLLYPEAAKQYNAGRLIYIVPAGMMLEEAIKADKMEPSFIADWNDETFDETLKRFKQKYGRAEFFVEK